MDIVIVLNLLIAQVGVQILAYWQYWIVLKWAISFLLSISRLHRGEVSVSAAFYNIMYCATSTRETEMQEKN